VAGCNRTKTLYVEPGSPWENGYCESFNSKLKRRVPERRDLLHPEGGAGAGGKVAGLLQHQEATLIDGLQTTRAHSIAGRRGNGGKVESKERLPLFDTPDCDGITTQRPRTFGELRAQEIDWLRWMAANVRNKDVLEKFSQDPDSDVRMWVACNPMTPERVLGALAQDSVVFVRRGVAQNKSTPAAVLARLNEDAAFSVGALALRNRTKPTSFFSL
jgi:hypothetical protein